MTKHAPAAGFLAIAALLAVTVSPGPGWAQTPTTVPPQIHTRPATIGATGDAPRPEPGAPIQSGPRSATISSGGDIPAAAAPERVAVLDLEAVDASKGQTSAMTDRLREALLRTGKFTLVNRDQMDNIFKEQAFQQSVCTTQDCAAKAGKVLGIRKIIAGRVTKLDEKHWLVTLNVIDVETAQTIQAETLQYDGDFYELLSKGIDKIAGKVAGTEVSAEAEADSSRLPPSVRTPEFQVPPSPSADVAAPTQAGNIDACTNRYNLCAQSCARLNRDSGATTSCVNDCKARMERCWKE